MRNLLRFRVWDKRNNKWLDLDPITRDWARCPYVGLAGIEQKMEKETTLILVSGSEYQWLQTTGMNDVAGREIYEGDILRYEKRWVVEFGKNKGKVKVEHHDWEVFFSPTGQWQMRREGQPDKRLYGNQDSHFIIGHINEIKI